jgi:hypothetical protein
MKMRKWGRIAPRGALAVAVLALCALPVVLITSASATGSTLDGVATTTNTTLSPLTSGGSTTQFSVVLPANAACTGDTATGGYHVYSYLVPQGTNIPTVTFTSHPSTGYGFVNNVGVYYGAVNTAITTGQIPTLPTNFEWGPWVSNDGVPASTFDGGSSAIWEGGIACANSSGTLTDYWNTQLTFTASGSDPNGFTWSAIAGGPFLSQVAPTGATTTVAASAAFTDQLAVAGAVGGATYTVTSPATGISVSSSGAISTTETLAAGVHTVSGTDVDANSDPGTWSFALTVSAGTLTQTAPTSATVASASSSSFTDQLAVSGATGGVTYTVTSPAAGISVSSGGAISTTGTLAAGTHAVAGTDVDSLGDTGTWSFSLTVSPAPDTFTSASSTSGTVGQALVPFTVTTAGPTTPKYKEKGKLPKGVKFDKATHVLAGTPTSSKHKSAAGTYNVTFTATFGKGNTKVIATQAFRLTIAP